MQVTHNTRIEFDTYHKLKAFSEKTGESMAKITDKAILAYIEHEEQNENKD